MSLTCKRLAEAIKHNYCRLEECCVEAGGKSLTELQAAVAFVAAQVLPHTTHLKRLELPRLLPYPELAILDQEPPSAGEMLPMTSPSFRPIVDALKANAKTLTRLKLGALTTIVSDDTELVEALPTQLESLQVELRHSESLHPFFAASSVLRTFDFRTLTGVAGRLVTTWGGPADALTPGMATFTAHLHTLKLTMVTTTHEFWRLLNAHVPTLRTLQLAFCKVKATALEPIPHLTSFTSVSLDASEYVFVDLVDSVCENFQSLEHFGFYYLEGCENYPLTRFATVAKSLPKLTSLDLVGYTTTWTTAWAQLPNLKRLKVLDLSDHADHKNWEVPREMPSSVSLVTVPVTRIKPFSAFPATPIPTIEELESLLQL